MCLASNYTNERKNIFQRPRAAAMNNLAFHANPDTFEPPDALETDADTFDFDASDTDAFNEGVASFIAAWENGQFNNTGKSLFLNDESVDEGMDSFALNHFAYVEPDNKTPRVDEEDYLEGAERFAFVQIKTAVRQACNVNTSPAKRMTAAEWVFVPDAENDNKITFTLCCRALGIREFVLQVRLQYQFYKASIIYPQPLPFLAVTVPEVLCSEILYYVGERGLMIAKDIWDWPGYRADLLKHRHTKTLSEHGVAMTEQEYDKAVREMEVNGFIGISHGFWFFTGRNPEMMSATRRRLFSWSREF
jgi:hypothetical protein